MTKENLRPLMEALNQRLESGDFNRVMLLNGVEENADCAFLYRSLTGSFTLISTVSGEGTHNDTRGITSLLQDTVDAALEGQELPHRNAIVAMLHRALLKIEALESLVEAQNA
jgi:hypothetical protein